MGIFKEEDEVGKYKKKRDQKSKSKNKSNHKHTYDGFCLTYVKYPHLLDLTTYCTVCGKIGDRTTPTRTISDGRSIMMNRDEIVAKYPDAKIIQLEDYWQQYIPITKKEGD